METMFGKFWALYEGNNSLSNNCTIVAYMIYLNSCTVIKTRSFNALLNYNFRHTIFKSLLSLTVTTERIIQFTS